MTIMEDPEFEQPKWINLNTIIVSSFVVQTYFINIHDYL